MVAKFTADKVREMFPEPVDYQEGREATGAYCVGGALVRYVEPDSRDDGFPVDGELSRFLQIANPDLPMYEANAFASTITNANDGGHFERAWIVLQRALQFDPDNPTDPEEGS